MIAVSTLAMSKQDWLAARNTGIGGSDIAAMLGVSPYKSTVELWLEKTGMVEAPDLSEKESVYWGTVLEDVVAKEFEIRSGLKTKRRNAILRHDKYPFMLANVDRLIVGQRAGLECKTANWRQADKWDGDELPDEYYLQCQHYMAVTGLEKWFIAVLIGGNQFAWKEINRDDALIETLTSKCREFWHLVETKTRPPVDGSDASREMLSKSFPESNGQAIELPIDAQFWINQYEQASDNISSFEALKTEAENKLKDMLGENECGRIGERAVAWKSTKGRETFDTKRFKAAHPELAQQYITEGAGSRRFSIK